MLGNKPCLVHTKKSRETEDDKNVTDKQKKLAKIKNDLLNQGVPLPPNFETIPYHLLVDYRDHLAFDLPYLCEALGDILVGEHKKKTGETKRVFRYKGLDYDVVIYSGHVLIKGYVRDHDVIFGYRAPVVDDSPRPSAILFSECDEHRESLGYCLVGVDLYTSISNALLKNYKDGPGRKRKGYHLEKEAKKQRTEIDLGAVTWIKSANKLCRFFGEKSLLDLPRNFVCAFASLANLRDSFY